MGVPIIKSPLGGRGFTYEYGQTEFTEMLSYCLMQNIDVLAASGFEFSTDASSDLPQPFEVFLNQLQQGSSEPVPVPIQQIYAEFPEAAWNQQTLALQQQIAVIDRVRSSMQEKYDALPAQTKTPGHFQGLIQSLLDEIAEDLFWAAIRFLFRGAFFMSAITGVLVLGVLKIKELVDKIFESIGKCTTMIAEIQELSALSIAGNGGIDNQKAWDYFRLREMVLTRQQKDIHNMLLEIIALEEKAKQTIETTETTETGSVELKELVEAIQNLNMGDLSELVQAVKDLQYNGEEFVYKDGSSYVLHGKTLVGTE